MRKGLICFATAVAMLFSAGSLLAAPDYDFEVIAQSDANPPGPDGFFGLGATVAQESTIGVTHLEHSMKYDVGIGGFVGARTHLVPASLNNPPGVKYVLFDLTLPAAYPDTFADIGVTVFGHALNAPVPSFGNQVQFQDQLAMAPLGAGTHYDQRIDLDFSLGPYPTGIGQPFNAVFGPGQNQLTVSSAFQFFINKNALTPITVYIDNVRFVVPEPGTFGLLGMGAVVLGAIRRRRSR